MTRQRMISPSQPLICTLSLPNGTIAEVVVRSKRIKCRLKKFMILNSNMHRILSWPFWQVDLTSGYGSSPIVLLGHGSGCLKAAEKVPEFFFGNFTPQIWHLASKGFNCASFLDQEVPNQNESFSKPMGPLASQQKGSSVHQTVVQAERLL